MGEREERLTSMVNCGEMRLAAGLPCMLVATTLCLHMYYCCSALVLPGSQGSGVTVQVDLRQLTMGGMWVFIYTSKEDPAAGGELA